MRRPQFGFGARSVARLSGGSVLVVQLGVATETLNRTWYERNTAAEKYMPQLQHNMWVTHSRLAVLSIITGGCKWSKSPFPWIPCI